MFLGNSTKLPNCNCTTSWRVAAPAALLLSNTLAKLCRRPLARQVFEGRPPFAGLAPAEVMRLVREGKTLETPELLTHQGPKLRSVFERCMRSDPNRRPSMEDVVQILSVNRNDGPSMALW